MIHCEECNRDVAACRYCNGDLTHMDCRDCGAPLDQHWCQNGDCRQKRGLSRVVKHWPQCDECAELNH